MLASMDMVAFVAPRTAGLQRVGAHSIGEIVSAAPPEQPSSITKPAGCSSAVFVVGVAAFGVAALARSRRKARCVAQHAFGSDSGAWTATSSWLAASTRTLRTIRLAAAEKQQPLAASEEAAREAKGVSDEAASPVAPKPKPTAAEARDQLMAATDGSALPESQRSAVSNFFFPEPEELDMDKSMPLDDHIREFREGVFRTLAAVVLCVGVCLAYYKELTTALEAPAQAEGTIVKFVQLGPGEFFFVSLKAAVAVGLLLAFPYALFEAALYFTPALTKSERDVVGPTVLSSAVLFYAGVIFSQSVLAPAALGFFVSYSADVIESQFSIDQYFEFILSMGFATGLAFQVPILQVVLGLLNILTSEKLFSVWKYVIVASAVVGAILTPSTDPVTQLLLSGALCGLYFAGAGVLVLAGR